MALHDSGMVWTAQLSDPPGRLEAVPAGHDLARLDETIVCGLNGDAERGATALAARLARRLSWRLSLVPLTAGASETERLRWLRAAAVRDRAGLVVAGPVQAGAEADAWIELWRRAPCPLIALPPNAPGRTLGKGSVLCGIDERGPTGPTVRAAAGLAKAAGARLQFIQEGQPATRLRELARAEDAALLVMGLPRGAGASGRHGAVASLLRESPVPLMLVPQA